jgi:hypothetical protein
LRSELFQTFVKTSLYFFIYFYQYVNFYLIN